MPDNKTISAALNPKAELKRHMKKVMPFVQAVKQKTEQMGISALQQNLSFDEYEVLNINLNYLKNTLEVRFADHNLYFCVIIIGVKHVIDVKSAISVR